MPVGNQDSRGVPVALAVLTGCLNQFLDRLRSDTPATDGNDEA
jgi:hypothetical protein